MSSSFHDDFVVLFRDNFRRLQRYLGRVSGDTDLASDLAQDAFVRLYQRSSLPDRPEAWLITVATNLFRNARTKQVRRLRLLTPARGAESLADPPSAPSEANEASETRRRVTAVLKEMPERERCMLLLRAEGYGYRDIAAALELNEGSVGTLLARAKREFRTRYGDATHAP